MNGRARMNGLERAFESCAREPERDLRADVRRDRRAQFGLCTCGTPVAWHFDDANRWLACDHPTVVASRLSTALRLTLRFTLKGRR